MDKNYKEQIEALLFASGRLMDADTLLSITGASSKQVIENNAQKLMEEYDQRQSPLMVVAQNNGWKLTVREPFLPLVRNIVSETELPKTILETLAVIAWKAPVMQSDIIEIRHNKAYDHISQLEEMGFLRKEPMGRSSLLHLTEKFYKYFDVEGGQDIREVFSKVVSKSTDEQTTDEELNALAMLFAGTQDEVNELEDL